MRLPVRALLVVLAGLTAAASGLRPLDAHAQEVAFAERGPRFLQVRHTNQAPVEIDASSSGAMRLLVSVDLEEPTVGRVLKAIERQTGLRFVYSRDVVPAERPVSLRASSITVAAALTEVLLDANVDVLLSSGPQIALVPRRPVAAARDSGTIVGRVTDKATGSPIAGATVVAEAASRHSATTDNEGRFRMVGLAPDVYTVRVRYIGYAPQVGTVSVVPNVEQTIDFALDKSVPVLEELVATTPGGLRSQARAMPTPVTIITSEQIEQQRPQTLNNVIRQGVPGTVSFESPSSPATAQFSVRGATSLTGAGVMKVLIDGIEVANFAENPIDPASIERIEVIRGPQAATVYGPDAAQGVVQVFTKRGSQSLTRPELTVRAEVGLLETPYIGHEEVVRTNVGAEVRGGSPDASYAFGASWWQLPNWVDEGGSPSDQSVPSVFGGVRFARGKVSADVSGRYMVVNNYLNSNPLLLQSGFAPFSQPFFLAQRTTTQAISFSLGADPFPWWRNRFSAGIDERLSSSEQIQPRLTSPADTLLIVLDNSSTKTFVGYNTSFFWAPSEAITGTLTAGVDHYRLPFTQAAGVRTVNTTGSITPGPGGLILYNRTVVTNTGYFAQLEVGFSERLYVTAGVRADNNSTFGEELASPVAPRLGLAYTHEFGSVTAKVRVAYGRAIRAAAPGQTFGAVLPTQITLANPLLRPERQQGWDGGIDLFVGPASLSVTAYDQKAEDLILFVQTAATPVPTFQFQNVGAVKNRGIEVEGRLMLLADRLQLRGQYAYTHSRIENLGPGFVGFEQVGDRPVGVPTHTAGASASFAAGARTTLAGGLTYVGGFVENDALAQASCFGGTGPCTPTFDFRTEYPGFVKLNLSVTQQLGNGLSTWLAISNLTNNLEYEAVNSRPVQGRLTSLGMQFRY